MEAGFFPFSNRGGRRNSSNRGRGRNVNVPKPPLIQHGKMKLIEASDLSFGQATQFPQYFCDPMFTDPDMLAEFMKFQQTKSAEENKSSGSSSSQTQSQAEGSNTRPSYVNVAAHIETVVDEDSLVTFEQKSAKDPILVLEKSDLKWRDDPWKLFQRYLDVASYPAGSYKNRSFYENILISSGSAEFKHNEANTQEKMNFAYSRIIIKKIISIEEWGISSLKEKELFINKGIIKYTFWDYIQAFSNALLYENSRRKHTWFIKVCPEVFNNGLPNWFFDWWQFHGPSEKILPDQFRRGFEEWKKYAPSLLQEEDSDRASFQFYSEFGIPWIWKWCPEVGVNQFNNPCLQRTYYCKWWNKMLQFDKNTKRIEGKDTLNNVNLMTQVYKEKFERDQQKEASSILGLASEKIRRRKGKMSKADLMNEVFKMVQEQVGQFEDNSSDTEENKSASETASMSSKSTSRVEDFQEAQDPEDNIPSEEAVRKFIADMEQQNKL